MKEKFIGKGLSNGKVCSLCGERAWMYTSTKGEYRCWKWMMYQICDY
jgi:hypothetical protein